MAECKDMIVFDMDGTLTESRCLMSIQMKTSLKKLNEKYIVAIISGSTTEQIRKQIGDFFFQKDVFVLAQSGNEAYKSGKRIWSNKMKKRQVEEVIKYLNEHTDGDSKKIQVRGAQISYSFVGHDAPLSKKKVFDKDRKKRSSFLKIHPFVSETLEVKIGGTTCLDFNMRGRSKGHYVKKLSKMLKVSLDDVLFVGDGLFKNGNDESVIGVCKTKSVSNVNDTMNIIKELCA